MSWSPQRALPLLIPTHPCHLTFRRTCSSHIRYQMYTYTHGVYMHTNTHSHTSIHEFSHVHCWVSTEAGALWHCSSCTHGFLMRLSSCLSILSGGHTQWRATEKQCLCSDKGNENKHLLSSYSNHTQLWMDDYKLPTNESLVLAVSHTFRNGLYALLTPNSTVLTNAITLLVDVYPHCMFRIT